MKELTHMYQERQIHFHHMIQVLRREKIRQQMEAKIVGIQIMQIQEIVIKIVQQEEHICQIKVQNKFSY